MTPEELDALPDRAVVLAVNYVAVQKHNGNWYDTDGAKWTTGPLALSEPVLLHPVPELDHSMCARLVADETGFLPGSPHHGESRFNLVSPGGFHIFSYTGDEARAMGFAIPEPEPTVVERAAEILSVQDTYVSTPLDVAQALADAGLLIEDGEQ